MSADLDALREGLARTLALQDGWQNPDALWTDNIGLISRGCEGNPVYQDYLEEADALIASPILSDLIAKAGRVEAAEAVLDRYEPQFRTDALKTELQTLAERVAFACHEAIDGREGERRLAERASITLDVTAADNPAVLIDAMKAMAVQRDAALARATAAEAESERLRAERNEARSHLPEGLKDASLVGAVQALAFSANTANDSRWRWGHALTIGLAFADKAAGEEWEHGGMASIDVCHAMAATLKCECDSDEWAQMAGAGAARLAEHKAALAATQPDSTEARHG